MFNRYIKFWFSKDKNIDWEPLVKHIEETIGAMGTQEHKHVWSNWTDAIRLSTFDSAVQFRECTVCGFKDFHSTNMKELRSSKVKATRPRKSK